MKELEDRYGDSHVIATAFIKKALDWPSIRPDDSRGLDDFALFLVECENAVASIEAVQVLEYPDNMKRLVAKLPFYLHYRWRNIVQKSKKQGDIIKFRDLVKFVKDEAKKVSDPVYGKEAMVADQKGKGSKDRISKRPWSNRSKVSLATQPAEENTVSDSHSKLPTIADDSRKDVEQRKGAELVKSCMYCNATSHWLDKCQRFSDLPPGERSNYIKIKGLCFGCLKPGHRKRFCRNKSTCSICNGCHPTVLHIETHPISRGDCMGESSNQGTSVPVNPCSYMGAGEANCAMAIIPVRVKLKNKASSVETYAFFDTGSSVSFCTENLLQQLGATGKQMQLSLETMGELYTMRTCAVNGLQICGLDSGETIDLPRLYSKEQLPVSKNNIPTRQDIECWSHLCDLDLPESDVDVGLMIGCNVPDAYAPFEVRTGPRGSPHATKTILGWIVWNIVREHDREVDGKAHANAIVNRAQISAITEVEGLQQLDSMLRNSINLDFPERLSDDKKENSLEDQRFLQQANDSLCIEDGHYSLDLPFRNRDVKLPNNKPQGLQRLMSLKRKMLQNQQLRNDYVHFMEKIFDNGYAEPVPAEDLDKDDGHIWYIPHHGVYHPRKPNKIRVVFDCSAKYLGVSLNDQLLQGPDLTNSLFGVLIRFRQERISIMGDIESMFFQVKVSKKDTDYLRFLWWPDGNLDLEPVPYRMVVHLFGAVSSPSCSNFALKRTAEDNQGDFSVPLSLTT